jgi:hypothetical protein
LIVNFEKYSFFDDGIKVSTIWKNMVFKANLQNTRIVKLTLKTIFLFYSRKFDPKLKNRLFFHFFWCGAFLCLSRVCLRFSRVFGSRFISVYIGLSQVYLGLSRVYLGPGAALFRISVYLGLSRFISGLPRVYLGSGFFPGLSRVYLGLSRVYLGLTRVYLGSGFFPG